MTLVAVFFAGLAGLLVCAVPATRVADRRLAADETTIIAETVRTPRKWLIRSGGVAAAVGTVVLAGWAGGARGAALTVPVLLIAGTVLILTRQSSRRRRAARKRRAVTQACSMLAAQMRVGQIPLDALRSVAQDCPTLAPAVSTADLGGDVVQQWYQQASEPGRSGLADLARAWELSIRTGASMTKSLDDLAQGLRDDEALELVITSEAAGPRASGKIMAGLPFVATGMGYLLGGDPVGFLVGSSYGWACLICGCAFACGGVLWMDRVASRVTTGTT